MARINVNKFFTTFYVLAAWLMSGIFAQNLFDEDLYVTGDAGVTEGPSGGSTTKGYSGPGPDELVTVDYIIIAVTCLLVGGTFIGGIVFVCRKNQASQRKRDELYSEYLEKSQYAGVKPGHSNKGFLDG